MEIELLKKLNWLQLEVLIETEIKMCSFSLEEMLDFLSVQIIKVIPNARACIILKVFPQLEDIQVIAWAPDKAMDNFEIKPDFLNRLKAILDKETDHLILDTNDDYKLWFSGTPSGWEEIGHLLVLPLIVRNEVSGLVLIGAAFEKTDFAPEEIVFCKLLGSLVELLIERDLIQEEKDEREAMEIIKEISNAIAHEMRNPLQVIGGFSRRLLKSCSSNQRALNQARIIAEHTTKLESKLNSLLLLYGSEGEKPVVVDINEIVESVVELLREKGMKVKVKMAFEAKIFAGKAMLKNAFLTIAREVAKIADIKSSRHRVDVYIETLVLDKESSLEIFIIVNGLESGTKFTKSDNMFLNAEFGQESADEFAKAIEVIKTFGGKFREKKDKLRKVTVFDIRFPLPRGDASKGV